MSMLNMASHMTALSKKIFDCDHTVVIWPDRLFSENVWHIER